MGLAERLKREIEAEAAFGGTLAIVAAPQRGNSSHARLCLGLSSDASLMGLLAPLGVSALSSGGFSWRGLVHDQPGDALLAALPDPERVGLPMLILLGVDAQALARRSFELPAPWIPRLMTWQAGGLAFESELELDGSPRISSLRELAPARAALDFEAPQNAGSALRVHAGQGVDKARVRAYVQACQDLIPRVEGYFGRPFEGRIELYLYAHAELMQRALGRAELGWLDSGSLTVHALLAPGLAQDGGAQVARAVALGIAGQPRQSWWLDALGTSAAGSWWGRDALELSGLLQAAQLQLSFAEASDESAAERFSVHRLTLARAWYAWNGWLDPSLGIEAPLAAVWDQRENPRASGAASLQPLQAGQVRSPSAAGERREALVQKPWRGVALYSGAAGNAPSEYASRRLEQALDQAKGFGANGFSLTIRVADDHPSAWLSGSRSALWATASDAELASALAAGRARGMGGMLVLDPLLGVGQGRVDLGKLNDVPGRELLMRRMQLFALHYGLLGELLGLDILCLGSSLTQGANTLLTEEDQEKPVMLERKRELQRGWIELIERTRRVYSGALTYASQLGLPLYQVSFWEQLDFVGLLGFGPQSSAGFLGGGDAVSAAALRLELGRQLRKGLVFQEKTGRPPLFVQLGFPASDASWSDWSSSKGAPDAQAQQRFFEAMALELSSFVSRKLKVNFFLWNWSIQEEPQPGAVGDYSLRGRVPGATLGQLLGTK